MLNKIKMIRGNSIVMFMAPLSYTGIVLAVVFFSISLSPSLLPRPYVLQGILSGIVLALGYGLGVVIKWFWDYLKLPLLRDKVLTRFKITLSILSAVLFFYSVYYSSQWQNDVRELMKLEASESHLPFLMMLIAIGLAALLFLLTKLISILFIKIKFRFKGIIPHRIANVVSFFLVAALVFFLTNNMMIGKIVSALDNTYLIIDENIASDLSPPKWQSASGSSNSHIPWQSIGKTGQEFIINGPDKHAIESFWEKPSLQPLRVYVGLRSKETAEQRAELALQELIRTNAFERSKLVIATPTGTGWLDPHAVDTFEYIHQGDTAIVAMQYSYLPSWLTLLVDPSGAKESARQLYNKVHGYWSQLDKETRPDLYLFGLSLGAYGAETSINLMTIINNPIQGGLFAGAPFTSTIAPMLTRHRNEGSPQWLPIIQDSSMVRFSAQENSLINESWLWGPVRVVYIQYASDPIVFFSPDLYRKEPDWMTGVRGYDVSKDFQWFPLITFFQVLFDIPMADKMPRGSSHSYSASSYIDGWVEVSTPAIWTNANTERLERIFDNVQ